MTSLILNNCLLREAIFYDKEKKIIQIHFYNFDTNMGPVRFPHLILLVYVKKGASLIFTKAIFFYFLVYGSSYPNFCILEKN